MIVHTGADNIVLCMPCKSGAKESDRCVARGHVKILELCAPLRHDHPLHTPTQCPSSLRSTVPHRAARVRHVNLITYPPYATGDVGEPRSGSITQASTNGAKPGNLLVHVKRNSSDYSTSADTLRGALEIALDAKNHRTNLPIVAELPTADESRHIARGKGGPRTSPSATDIHASVEAGPERMLRCRSIGRRVHRQVGSESVRRGKNSREQDGR